MTPAQRRRLDNAAAGLSPCLGCLIEDRNDADAGSSATLHRLRVKLDAVLNEHRLKQGLTPLPPDEVRARAELPTLQEIEEERELQHQPLDQQQLLERLAPHMRLESCLSCQPRRISRERRHAQSIQIHKAIKMRAEEEAESVRRRRRLQSGLE